MTEKTKKNPNWSEDELKMAINLYGKIPFKSTRKTSPEIIKWAKIIGRSPGALYTKLCNLGHFDKAMHQIGVSGLSHTGKLDSVIWQRFENDPESVIYEGEQLLASRLGKPVEEFSGIDIQQLPIGTSKSVVIRQRVGQRFFRDAVLMAYNNRCCITGISVPSLLEACHISSWKDDEKNRTNPKNGLCLNSLFHKAFDKYLLTITPNYEIVISEKMISDVADSHFASYLKGLQHRHIYLPDKFIPDVNFLAFHNEQFFKNQ